MSSTRHERLTDQINPIDALEELLRPQSEGAYPLAPHIDSRSTTTEHPPSGSVSALWWHVKRLVRSPLDSAVESRMRTLSTVYVHRVSVSQGLAQAALELARTDFAFGFADRVDATILEEEADREKAARAEGQREPCDPHEILAALPEIYHAQFLTEYRRALRAAYPTEGFLALQQTLKRWRLLADRLSDTEVQAEHERAIRAIESGDLSAYVSAEEYLRGRAG